MNLAFAIVRKTVAFIVGLYVLATVMCVIVVVSIGLSIKLGRNP